VRTVLRIALAVIVAAGGVAAIVLALQRRLLYFPVRQDPATAERAAARLGLSPWRDARGAIAGWRAAHPSGAPETVAVVLHGNAGSALDRGYLRDVLQARGVPPLEVILLEYPGYGPREGAPSEQALVGAAVEAIDALAASGAKVLLVGESLGSAVASCAAAERPAAVAGVVLVTPLASVPAVARRHYPGIPSFLLRDRYESAQALARFGGRAFFLLAGRDEVVFADLGRALFDGYRGPKRLAVEEGASHNGLRYDPSDATWRDAVTFLLGR
jgi:pimeloyl-ACP methyl ester carboxylesterase